MIYTNPLASGPALASGSSSDAINPNSFALAFLRRRPWSRPNLRNIFLVIRPMFLPFVPRHRPVLLLGRSAISLGYTFFWGLLCILSALVPQGGRAQLLVEAPVLESIASNQTGILATMNLTLNAIEQAERKVETIKEVATWIDQLESMQEFIRLLETTACLAKDLDVDLRIAMNLLGAGAYCLSDFEYRLNINRLRYVVDIINLVLADGFNMTRSGRMEAYQNALSTLWPNRS